MTFAVVTWKSKGSSPLPAEEVEVLNLQKLVIDGEAAEGSKCSMQYHQQMWHGEIHSLHEKKNDAIDASEGLFSDSDQDPDPLPSKRPRKGPASAGANEWSFA